MERPDHSELRKPIRLPVNQTKAGFIAEVIHTVMLVPSLVSCGIGRAAQCLAPKPTGTVPLRGRWFPSRAVRLTTNGFKLVMLGQAAIGVGLEAGA